MKIRKKVLYTKVVYDVVNIKTGESQQYMEEFYGRPSVNGFIKEKAKEINDKSYAVNVRKIYSIYKMYSMNIEKFIELADEEGVIE